MFLYDLDPEQQDAFFALLRRLVQADDTLASEEQKARVLLRRETGRDGLPDPESISLEEAFSSLTERSDQIAVLLELLLVAHVDGEYHPEENHLILDLADQFDVSMERLEQLKNWALRQVSLIREAEQLRRTDEPISDESPSVEASEAVPATE
jgi:uncharacterized tellurite resistance protein B-like protein